MCVSGHFGIVRHEDHRNALGVEFLEHPQNLDARVRVQVAGWLVGQNSAGRLTSARAIATRCCCPPDICDGTWSVRCVRPTRSKSNSPRRRTSRDEDRRTA